MYEYIMLNTMKVKKSLLNLLKYELNFQILFLIPSTINI
jgi:hypothetical protein